jgi:hypothetical protein
MGLVLCRFPFIFKHFVFVSSFFDTDFVRFLNILEDEEQKKSSQPVRLPTSLFYIEGDPHSRLEI